MSETPKPVLPLRLGAVLTVRPSVPVRVSATADGLQMRGAFGDLTVPYSLMTQVGRDVNGAIRLDLSGTIVQLDCDGVPAMALNALLNLLEEKRRRCRT